MLWNETLTHYELNIQLRNELNHKLENELNYLTLPKIEL